MLGPRAKPLARGSLSQGRARVRGSIPARGASEARVGGGERGRRGGREARAVSAQLRRTDARTCHHSQRSRSILCQRRGQRPSGPTGTQRAVRGAHSHSSSRQRLPWPSQQVCPHDLACPHCLCLHRYFHRACAERA